MTRVRLSHDAEEELLAAATWYEDKRIGLGIDLVADVDAALDQIAVMPESCPLWRRDRPYRQKVLARFPYVIFFLIRSDVIDVVAIAHTKRRPGYWRDR
jgi:plasmid stabilization system protein ParE